MLKYHFTLQDGKKEPIEFDAGRTANWKAVDYADTLPDSPSKDARFQFAWAYYAAEQAGKLEALEIPEGAPIEEAIEYIADQSDVVRIDDNSKEPAPLASTPEN